MGIEGAEMSLFSMALSEIPLSIVQLNGALNGVFDSRVSAILECMP